MLEGWAAHSMLLTATRTHGRSVRPRECVESSVLFDAASPIASLGMVLCHHGSIGPEFRECVCKQGKPACNIQRMYSAGGSEGKHKRQVVVESGENIATVLSLFHRVYGLKR